MTTIDWATIHETRGFSLATPPLALLSFFYGLGVRLRLLYCGRINGKSLPGFVVSIGNLSVGGTGKTPAAAMLAEWALNKGYRVALLSRGYGGRNKKEVLEVSNDHEVLTGPDEAGDEPFLLAKRLREVPVIISKKRYLAGLLAHNRYKTNFFILDDGFQHLALKRDLDLVLMDAQHPFGNGHLLPWGPLREPVGQLNRADAFLITRSGKERSNNHLIDSLNRRFPGRPVFNSDHTPNKIVFPDVNKAYDPDFLKGKRVIAFAGIARPEMFRETLIQLGAEPVFFRGFEDHHAFHPDEIQGLISEKERLKADCLLTTEKDWVRIERLSPDYPGLGYLTIKFTLLSERGKFFGMIKDRVGRRKAV